MSNAPITVLKFGGSVLRDGRCLSQLATEVYRWLRRGHKVIAVVSAYYGITDRLQSRASALGAGRAQAAAAALIATGEQRSTAHLALTLARDGVSCRLLGPAAAGLRAEGPILDADLVDLNVPVLRRALEANDVLVLPGYLGINEEGDTALLGRGGSDLSALFVAQRLGADFCRLVKDTPGLFEWDPHREGPIPRLYREITWSDAELLDEAVLQPKALAFAKRHKLAFAFSAPGARRATLVGARRTVLSSVKEAPPPLRVALAGCGTVGGGVATRLLADPNHFPLCGIAARHPDRYRSQFPGDFSWATNPLALTEGPADVVVETIGGVDSALQLIRTALYNGRHVVTANKAVLAKHGAELYGLARLKGVSLLDSASVGGGAPMLESVRRLATSRRITHLRGVLNGTTNFILDQVAGGRSFEKAVQDAIENGFAEADPSADLSGNDAACKLSLLVEAAAGRPLPLGEINASGIKNLDADEVRARGARGDRLRLVAEATLVGHQVQAAVALCWLRWDDPLAAVFNEENLLEVTDESGRRHSVGGRGAGRKPTSLAMVADLFDLWRQCSARPGGLQGHLA